jgi:hypothetical protein
LEIKAMQDERIFCSIKEAKAMVGVANEKFYKLINAEDILISKDGPRRTRILVPSVWRHLQCGYGWYDKRFVCPAMIGWTYSLFGGEMYKPAAVHVTFLRRDGSGKADVPVPKRTFGVDFR